MDTGRCLMFTQAFNSITVDGDKITCTVDGFILTATIYRDDDTAEPFTRDEGFWPSRDPKAPGYVLPENYDAELAKARMVLAAWKRDEWWYVGVAVTVSKAGIQLTGKYDHACWGIDCNYPGSDNSYLLEVANEEANEALEAAKAKLAELCSG